MGLRTWGRAVARRRTGRSSRSHSWCSGTCLLTRRCRRGQAQPIKPPPITATRRSFPGAAGHEPCQPLLELAEQLLRVDPELLQQVGVLLVVDLVGQLLLRLLDLVVLPLSRSSLITSSLSICTVTLLSLLVVDDLDLVVGVDLDPLAAQFGLDPLRARHDLFPHNHPLAQHRPLGDDEFFLIERDRTRSVRKRLDLARVALGDRHPLLHEPLEIDRQALAHLHRLCARRKPIPRQPLSRPTSSSWRRIAVSGGRSRRGRLLPPPCCSLGVSAAPPPTQPRRRPPAQLGPPRDRARPHPPPRRNSRRLPTPTRNRQDRTRGTTMRQTRTRPLLLPPPPRNLDTRLDNIEASKTRCRGLRW